MDQVTYSITIIWGTEGEETKTYTFKTLEELEAFRDGVHESNGWWEYEIKEEQDDQGAYEDAMESQANANTIWGDAEDDNYDGDK